MQTQNQVQAKSARISGATGARTPQHFVPLTNKPGILIDIDKNQLSIDQKYQRVLNLRMVQRIADNWSWIAAGAITVSLRAKSDKYFIVDGQHRWEASKLLREVKTLPCLVFELDQIQDEAMGFLASNAERKSLKPTDRYPALLLAKDPVALIIDQLAREAGRTIRGNHDRTSVACVGRLMRCIKENESALRRVWPIIIELCKDAPISEYLVGGIWSLERRLKRGTSLTERRWCEQLTKIGREGIEQSIRNTATLLGQQRNERVLAQGVLNAINKGTRNKLEVTV